MIQPNAGVATARNHGARLASGDLLVFCDDDVLVEPDHLTRHLETQRRFSRSLVNGVSQFAPVVLANLRSTSFGRYRIELEGRFEAEADGRPLADGCVETGVVSGRNLALRRDLFWELGGFDEEYPYAGAEDHDLSLRARRAGCLLLRDHGIAVLNNESTITFESFCTREERSAETAVLLARKIPEHASQRPIVVRNAAIESGDPVAVIAVKLAKSVLSRSIPLRAQHGLISSLERRRASDRTLWRWYRHVVGLHIFRGVRAAQHDVQS
jgi:GT2 family glycosyltransferase